MPVLFRQPSVSSRRGLPARRVGVVLLAMAFIAGASSPIFAQSAVLAGQVTDPDSAVIRGATVQALHRQTQVTFTTRTNSSGGYRLTGLPSGEYTLVVSAPGLAAFTAGPLRLALGEELVFDVSLTLSTVSESVEVAVPHRPIGPRDGSVSTTLTREAAETLPLNGRTFQRLFTLVPGVVQTKFSTSGQFSANGQRPTSNYFTLDGVSANVGGSFTGYGAEEASGTTPAYGATGGTNSLVSVEALDEIQISTSSFAAEYGRTPGAQVRITTRAGTNAFHGSGFTYFRDERLTASNWFANRAGQADAEYNFFNGGAVLGGPIVSKRAFFFASYERQDVDSPRFAENHVPSPALRAAATSAARRILESYPIANGRDIGNGLAAFASAYQDSTTLDAYSIRGDYAGPSSLRLFGRYSHAPSDFLERGSGGSGSLASYDLRSAKTRIATFGADATTGGFILESRLNVSHHRLSQERVHDGFGGAAAFPFDALGVPSDANVLYYVQAGIPGAYISSGHAGGSEQRQFNAVVNASSLLGTHFVKFGVDYRRLSPDLAPPPLTLSLISASPTAAASGQLQSATINYDTAADPLIENYSLYAQDTWRATQDLTLSYGLRWDYNPAPRSAGDLDPIISDFPTSSTGPNLHSVDSLWAASRRGFAPRLGASYVARRGAIGDTVLRGGVGRFIDSSPGKAAAALGDGFPFRQRVILQNTTAPLSASALVPPVFNPSVPGSSTVYAIEPELEPSETTHWNTSVEQALWGRQVLTVTYAGARGRNLLRPFFFGPPGRVPLTAIVNEGKSQYHALQMSFQRRLSGSWSALASYTYSRSKDDGSTEITPGAATESLDLSKEWAPSDFDVPHALTVTVTGVSNQGFGGRVMRALTSEWTGSLIGTYTSGFPVTPSVPRNVGFGTAFYRPDLVPNVPLTIDAPNEPGGFKFNRDAFVVPTALRQGTSTRNLLRGQALRQVDVSLQKHVRLHGSIRASLRIDVFNAFNIPSFDTPVGTVTSALFGTVTRLANQGLGEGGTRGLSSIYQVGGPRTAQIGVRVEF